MTFKVVPMIKLYDNLIVPIQIELDDTTVELLQKQLLDEIERQSVKGIILDVSIIDVIDSYISFTISETAKMAKMMGCKTVICGLQPSVALTLSQMGVKLDEIYFAMSLEDAIEHLKESKD